jgi:hypothetical protein
LAGRKGTAVLLMVASAGLLAAAIPQVISEADALIGALRPVGLRLAAINSGEHLPAGSYLSKDEYLRSCLDLPGSLAGLLRPAAERAHLLRTCRDAARAIARDMPTYALPHLVDANASTALDEPFAEPLATARLLAPHVHWQVDRRVILARAQYPRLDNAGRAGFDEDLAELFGSAEGRRVLAMHFLRWPDQRDRLTGIAETVPMDAQRDFLAKVKLQAGGAP